MGGETADEPSSSRYHVHKNDVSTVGPQGHRYHSQNRNAKRKYEHEPKQRRDNSKHLKWTNVARQRYIDAQDQYGRGEGGGVT